jgi:hypothetical protein
LNKEKKPPDKILLANGLEVLKVSNTRKRKLLSMLYENSVMHRKRNVDSLIMANEGYNSNLPFKDEFCMLFKAKMVLRKLFDIGVDIVNHQRLSFGPVKLEFEVFKDVPVCGLEPFANIWFVQSLEVVKLEESSLIHSEREEKCIVTG